MKMDFPHPANSDPAGRSRARYAELVACAANAQLGQLWWQADRRPETLHPVRSDELDARIDYFSCNRNVREQQVFGAFLPEAETVGAIAGKDESGVNLAASAIGKPDILRSHYPAHPDSLWGMEN